MVSLRWLKFGGTYLHWPKPSDKSDISLKTETLLQIHMDRATECPVDNNTASVQLQSQALVRKWQELPGTLSSLPMIKT
jgi:hypothetical protein